MRRTRRSSTARSWLNKSSRGARLTIDDLRLTRPLRHAVDAHREVADATGRVVARCSLWWRRTPSLARHRVGLIGHYAASLPEAAGVLLERACGELASVGCTLAVGPMDGSSWRRYRFVTRFGTEPPFFLG